MNLYEWVKHIHYEKDLDNNKDPFKYKYDEYSILHTMIYYFYHKD